MNWVSELEMDWDCFPFGMQMPGRKYQSPDYRYGFNGMEKDDEVKGSGNSYDFGARMYDSRVGRWLSRDKMEGKKPFLAPYLGFRNNPLMYIDPDGNDEYLSYVLVNEKTGKTTRIDNLTASSTKIMADGSGSSNVHSNNYYDFRTVKTYTMQEDGSTYVNTSYEIIYDDGLKDFDLAYGTSNTKPKGHIKDEADGWTWGQATSKQTQPGGFRLTSEDGGASTTKVISENDVESRDIGALLAAAGGLQLGSLGSDAADKIKDLVGFAEYINELVEDDGSSGGTGEGNTETGQGGTPDIDGYIDTESDSITVEEKTISHSNSGTSVHRSEKRIPNPNKKN